MSDDLIDAVSKSLRNAWQLGQTYFQQADSESYSQNRKSDETQKKFEALIEDTRLFVIAATAPRFGDQPAPQGVAEVMLLMSQAVAKKYDAGYLDATKQGSGKNSSYLAEAVLEHVRFTITAIINERDTSRARSEHLKQEAQIHAQEARTANATIAEIYRLISGGTGEPGNWHGAEPVRALVQERDTLRERAAELEKDAGRYRWLRNRLPGSAYRIAGVIYSEGGAGVDTAIDAAIAAAKEAQ